MAELAVNGAQSTLATAPSGTTGTSLAIQSGDTGKFPSSGNFACILQDSLTSPTQYEIIEVTAVSGATFTITRASEAYAGSQTAQTWSAGAYITQVATAGTIRTVQIPSFDTTVLTKLSLAPVAYWKLNDPVGSATAADSSGNGYTLTKTGTVTFGVAGVVPTDSETCAKGDGSTGILATTAIPALVPTGNNPMTMLMVVKYDGQASEADYLTWGAVNAGNMWQLGIFPNRGTMRGSAYGNDVASSQILEGVPTLVGFSWDGISSSLLFNGHVVATNYGASNTVASSNVSVLAQITNANYTTAPVGRVAIFAGVLTPKDWALLMQAFTGV